jgi:prepilin-type N-terminal cleavage/methylation domain-containing protein
MPRMGRKNGFTLVELVVVIVLIGIILSFSAPRLRTNLFSDGFRHASQWIILSVSTMKERSAREQKDYFLNIDIDANRFWITDDTMVEEEIEAAALTGYALPETVNVMDVEYPDSGRVTSGETDIRFYGKGYSDKALIHIENDDGQQRSLLIEPFLRRVKLFEDYIAFET